MARVYLGLALEGVLDRLTDPPGLRGGVMVMRSVTPTTPRTDGPSARPRGAGMSYLTLPSSVTQPFSTLGADLAWRDLDVVVQDVGDCGGDLGVVPWGAGQLDLDVVGHGFYPVDPFCCTSAASFSA